MIKNQQFVVHSVPFELKRPQHRVLFLNKIVFYHSLMTI